MNLAMVFRAEPSSHLPIIIVMPLQVVAAGAAKGLASHRDFIAEAIK
jgi:hypothetical protein